MKISLTEKELATIVTALCNWGDQVVEMADDKPLHPDDVEVKVWAEQHGHDVERLEHRLKAILAFSRKQSDVAWAELQKFMEMTV